MGSAYIRRCVHYRLEIANFFDVYKDLEPDKLTKVGGFDGVDAAWEEIERSYERARSVTSAAVPGDPGVGPISPLSRSMPSMIRAAARWIGRHVRSGPPGPIGNDLLTVQISLDRAHATANLIALARSLDRWIE